MAYRLESDLQTGYALEAVSGTPQVLTADDYVGMYDNVSIISLDTEKSEFTNAGSVGPNLLVSGKSKGTLGNIDIRFAMGQGLDLLETIGAKVVAGTGYTDYIIGKSLTACKSATFQQCDGNQTFIVSGARPTNLKLGAKSVGSEIILSAGFIGAGSHSVTNPNLNVTEIPDFIVNTLQDNSLLIDNYAFQYSDFELDFAPKCSLKTSGASTSGYHEAVVSSLAPVISLTLNPGDAVSKNLLAMYQSKSIIDFSFSCGSGTNNTYVLTSKVQIKSHDATSNEGSQIRKVVLQCVKGGTDHLLKIRYS